MRRPEDANCPPTIDALLMGMLERARLNGDDVAIVEVAGPWRRLTGRAAKRITYAELERRITCTTVQLARRGMNDAGSVLYAVRSGVDSMTLLSAILLAGPTVVGLDPGIGAHLLAQRLELLSPRWVVAESIVYAACAPGLLRAWLQRRGLVLPDIRLPGATFLRVGAWLPGVPPSLPCDSLWRGAPRQAPAAAKPAERAAMAIFTSGTTSAPKTVLHTAASLGAAFSIIGRLMALRPSDVVYSNQTHQILAALMASARCVVSVSSVDAARRLDALERHHVTHTYAVPFEMAELVDLLERQGRRLPDHLRVIILASAPIHRVFLQRLRAVCGLGTDIWCTYGMSEMFPVALVESREKLAFVGDGDLVGTPVDGIRVEIAEDGELLVGGPHLFARYAGGPAVDMHATGDLARIDAQGRIVLHGRKKDMIIRGHYNIYPSLYEDTIAAIAGVESCALVGLPNKDQTDERLILVVQPRHGEDGVDLRRRVQRALADGSCAIDSFALPDDVVVARLPRAGRSHKMDRSRLAEIAAAELSSRAS